jgi:phosphotriesterase-related protein
VTGRERAAASATPATARVVRTVTGDVAPVDLGPCLAHEHLIIDTPLVADRWPEIHLTSVDEAVAELGPCRAAGVATVVDAMPAAAGRDVIRLAEISERSGVRIVAATGLHTEKYYVGQAWTREEAPEVLAELFIADLVEGVDRHDYLGPIVRRTAHRAGIVKVASSGEAPTARDLRLFEAAAIAHRRTGAAVLTHCEAGRGGLAQVEALGRLGVPADRLVLSHTDKVHDLGYHRELRASGANLVYDQALRQGESALEGTAALVADAVGAGESDRLLVGTDAARRTLWSVHGGPGIAWIVTGLGALLGRLGLGEEVLRELLVTTPARVLPMGSD